MLFVFYPETPDIPADSEPLLLLSPHRKPPIRYPGSVPEYRKLCHPALSDTVSVLLQSLFLSIRSKFHPGKLPLLKQTAVKALLPHPLAPAD